ncbi:MAG UNVERIFIED_CONTAM: hypothetical protein LVT10_13315 [Anaerolineae bacterium]
MRKTFGWKSQSLADYERQIARGRAYFSGDFLMPTFIDNHDMNRFLHIAEGDKDALRAALAAQMKLPAPPILYYGTEIGLNHTASVREGGLEAGRAAMIWDEQQDRTLLNDVSALIHERGANRKDGRKPDDSFATYSSTPNTVVGDLRVWQDVYSAQLDNRRDIFVWLPPSL